MEPGQTYHLYTHANGFGNLFRSHENYRYFLRRYQRFIPPVADTLAYCLMPNHVHSLVRVKSEQEIQQASSEVSTRKQPGLGDLSPVEKRISQQFSNLFNSYTKAFNKQFGRKGSLFIPNFKRKEITSGHYLTNIIRYIHANPVHHGFTKDLSAWPWSSYMAVMESRNSLVNHEEIIQWFGNLSEFIVLHSQPITAHTGIES